MLDHPLLSGRYFLPRRVPLPGACWVELPGGDRLACHRSGPPGEGGVLLHFHGNGEVVADNLALVPHLAALGPSVFLAEYRGYGASTGTPRLGAMLDDTEAIFQAVGAPESRVVVYGRSVGSLYALEVAARHPGIAGLVLESGIADVLERLLLRADPAELGATREQLAAAVAGRLDHRAKLGAYRGPLLILHAAHDHLVDVTHAERNHAWSSSPVKRLVVLPRGDHNSILGENWEAYWEALSEFVGVVL